MVVIPIVIGAVRKYLVKGRQNLEIRGKLETILSTALLRLSEYWEEAWWLEGTISYQEKETKQFRSKIWQQR